MDEILEAFSDESKPILNQMIEVLEKIDEEPGKSTELAEFARLVDGVMGSAKVIAVDFPPDHLIQKIASFSELCKFIGQQGAKLEAGSQITSVITSFLMDASESLCGLNAALMSNDTVNVSEIINAAFLKRLRALSTIFDTNRKANDVVTKESATSAQDDIDSILKQLGA
jgi:hypothetical protein